MHFRRSRNSGQPLQAASNLLHAASPLCVPRPLVSWPQTLREAQDVGVCFVIQGARGAELLGASWQEAKGLRTLRPPAGLCPDVICLARSFEKLERARLPLREADPSST